MLPRGKKIAYGHFYYPTIEDGHTRSVKVIGKANLRNEPSLHSTAVGIAERGDEILVKYWTFGDEVKLERVWWLTYKKAFDPFKYPKHLWAASTSERPN